MNQKGFTIVEVLVCFVIISVVMMSLFSTISAFNEKKIQESYRAKVYEFKNEMTNMLQEDIIKKGLSYVKVTENNAAPGSNEGKRYTVNMTFRDGTKKKLIVYQRFTKTNYRIEGTPDQDDMFYIDYGTDEATNSKIIHYELPNLGESKGYYSNSTHTFIPEDDDHICHKEDGSVTVCQVAKDFQINNIAIIYIDFYHPNLGTKYAINIVAPIDFQSSTVDQNSKFPVNSTDANSTSSIYQKP